MCEFYKAQNYDNVARVYYDTESFKMKMNTLLNSKEYLTVSQLLYRSTRTANGSLYKLYCVRSAFYDLACVVGVQRGGKLNPSAKRVRRGPRRLFTIGVLNPSKSSRLKP